MNETIGKRIAKLRKEKNLTQDQLAQILDVSPQAVSKWENDLTCPDISLLPAISDYFNISIDELLKGKINDESKDGTVKEDETIKITKDISKLNLRVLVTQPNNNVVKVNVPMSVVKVALEVGGNIANMFAGDILKNFDVNMIISAVENGIVGKIVDVETENNEQVEVFIE